MHNKYLLQCKITCLKYNNNMVPTSCYSKRTISHGKLPPSLACSFFKGMIHVPGWWFSSFVGLQTVSAMCFFLKLGSY